MTPAKPPRDAATVVLLREHAGVLQTYLMRRNRKMSVLGGLHVFPGGKLDKTDCANDILQRIRQQAPEIAARMHETDPTIAAGLVVTAIRETYEEAGILLGGQRALSATHQAMRARLHGGEPLSAVAPSLQLSIDATPLVPYARWITPEAERSRFDARFFLAALPEGQEANHDGHEITDAEWLTPAEAIDRMHNATMRLAPPTLKTLEWLSDFHSISSALKAAADRPPPTISPKIIAQDQGWFLAFPGDPAHPDPTPVLPGPSRLIFIDWRWEPAPLPSSSTPTE